MLGFNPVLMAKLLVVFLAPVTFFVHDIWTIDDPPPGGGGWPAAIGTKSLSSVFATFGFPRPIIPAFWGARGGAGGTCVRLPESGQPKKLGLVKVRPVQDNSKTYLSLTFFNPIKQLSN